MTDEAPAKRSKGRPRVYPSTEKRPTLTFRVRGGLHDLLKDAAEKNERSLSEEIESRVASSFENSNAVTDREWEYERLIDYLGGKDRVWFLFLMSHHLTDALDKVDPRRNDDIEWLTSKEKVEEVLDLLSKDMPEVLKLTASLGGQLARSIGVAYQGSAAMRAMRVERERIGKKQQN